MKKAQNFISLLFGGAFLLLSVIIVLETLLRKFFNVSLQGIDELSGYVLAFGATLAFSSALLSGSHMRIDLVYRKYPHKVKLLLNLLSVISLGVFALFLAYVNLRVLEETHSYGSTAATPWATPLIIPQSFWLFGSVLFALLGLIQSWRLCTMILKGDGYAANQEFGPKGVKEELVSEVASLSQRAEQLARTESLTTTRSEEGRA